MALNPNIPIRSALIFLLQNITGLPVWHKKVPKDIKPVPNKYILLQSQSKVTTAKSKGNFEWLSAINIDITTINTAGFSSVVDIDNYEQLILNALEIDGFNIQNDFLIPNWAVKDVKLIGSFDLDAETATQTIERRILTINIWLWPIA